MQYFRPDGEVARRPGSWPCPGVALVALALAAVSAAAGEQPAVPPLTEVEQVRLVLLPTIVTDRRGRPVPGLSASEFTLLDEGRPQEIRLFASAQDAEISVAFLLDVSASMGLRGQLEDSKRAIAAFVEALGPKDRFGLIGFADEQVTWITPWTDDRQMFLRRLEVQEPGGKTALYDAMSRTPALVGAGGGERRAIVLFTDGLDNASSIPMLEAIWTARRVRVPIYAVSFVPMSPKLYSERVRDSLRVLGRFSKETGGGLHAVYRDPDLERAISTIDHELHQQYVLGYYPRRDPDQEDTFRRVELLASDPSWTVRTRTGYYP